MDIVYIRESSSSYTEEFLSRRRSVKLGLFFSAICAVTPAVSISNLCALGEARMPTPYFSSRFIFKSHGNFNSSKKKKSRETHLVNIGFIIIKYRVF